MTKKWVSSHGGKCKDLDLIPRIIKPNVSRFYHACSESGTYVSTKNHKKSNDKITIKYNNYSQSGSQINKITSDQNLSDHEKFLTSESFMFQC